jgi:hypothetical protein
VCFIETVALFQDDACLGGIAPIVEVVHISPAVRCWKSRM